MTIDCTCNGASLCGPCRIYAELETRVSVKTSDFREQTMDDISGIRDQARSHIETLLSELYEPEGVSIWMTSPHKWFDGKTAEDMITEGRATEVLAAVNILIDLIDGAFA